MIRSAEPGGGMWAQAQPRRRRARVARTNAG
jgi:hypothetical protein